MWLSILILVLFFVSQMIGGVIAMYMVDGSQIFSSMAAFSRSINHIAAHPIEVGISTLISELLLVAVLWLTRLSSRRPLSTFAQGMPKGWAWMLVGFLVVSIGLNFVLYPLDLDDMGMTEHFSAMSRNWLCVLMICVGAPMAEEFVFRDGIQRVLMEKGWRPWVCVLTSALCFAVVHMDLMQMIPAFLLGLLLGAFYVRSGDMRLCLPAHILNNTLGWTEYRWPEMTAWAEQLNMWTCVAVGAVLLVAGILIIDRH